MVSQSQQLSENVAPVLNDVTRRFVDMMGTAKSFLSDQPEDEVVSPTQTAKAMIKSILNDEDNIEDLGVLVCALPPKGQKKKEIDPLNR